MENPLFRRKPAPAVQAETERQLAAGQAVPKAGLMSGGGMMGAMLKQMGINPDAIDETAQMAIGGIEDVKNRLDRIEKLAIANDERSRSIESMLKDVLGRTADGAL